MSTKPKPKGPRAGRSQRGKRDDRRPGWLDQARELLTTRFYHDPTDLRTLQFWRGDWYEWAGTHYTRVPDSEQIKSAVRSWLYRMQWPHGIRDVSEVTAALRTLVEIRHDTNPPALLKGRGSERVAFSLVYRNAVVDFTEDGYALDQRDHTPALFNLNALTYDFDPGATCPAFLAFLDQVFRGDAERVELLRQWVGYLLSGSNHLQRVLLLVGPPRAGKGVTLRVLTCVLGAENVATPTLGSLAGTFGLWPLIDKSAAFFPDAHLGARADGIAIAERLKAISGGDAVDVERKYRDTLCGVSLPVRFVLAVNDLPSLHDPSGALARRLSILPFDLSFVGNEDFDLAERLEAEAAGIANWGLTGLRTLAKGGRLIEPQAARDLSQRYDRLSSPIRAFVEDCCELCPDAVIPRGELYREYRGHCEDNGRKPLTNDRFGEQLRSAFPQIGNPRPTLDGRRTWCYSGVKLNRGTPLSQGG